MRLTIKYEHKNLKCAIIHVVSIIPVYVFGLTQLAVWVLLISYGVQNVYGEPLNVCRPGICPLITRDKCTEIHMYLQTFEFIVKWYTVVWPYLGKDTTYPKGGWG